MSTFQSQNQLSCLYLEITVLDGYHNLILLIAEIRIQSIWKLLASIFFFIWSQGWETILILYYINSFCLIQKRPYACWSSFFRNQKNKHLLAIPEHILQQKEVVLIPHSLKTQYKNSSKLDGFWSVLILMDSF